MDQTLQDLARRIYLMVGRGLIGAVDDSGTAQRLQLKLSDDEIIDHVIRLTQFGLTSVPPVGGNAVALFMAGLRDNGCIIATGDQASRPTGLRPGETMLYSLVPGQRIYLSTDGIVIDGGGLPVTIGNTPGVRIESDLAVTGDIKDHCDDGTGSTMAAMRDFDNRHEHTNVRSSASLDRVNMLLYQMGEKKWDRPVPRRAKVGTMGRAIHGSGSWDAGGGKDGEDRTVACADDGGLRYVASGDGGRAGDGGR